MTIRAERPEEFAAIRRLIEEAFRTAQRSDGDEHRFAERRRTGGGYRPNLALVAEERGELVGHIMLTRFALDDGSPVLLLAPLCVALGQRGKGVGAALLREAVRRAAEEGHAAVVLVGDPDYYGRFGFRPAAESGIRNTDGIPDRYVQLLELSANGPCTRHTTVSFTGL